jgi:hypothetical protein
MRNIPGLVKHVISLEGEEGLDPTGKFYRMPADEKTLRLFKMAETDPEILKKINIGLEKIRAKNNGQ